MSGQELTLIAAVAAVGAGFFFWRPPAPGGALARKHLLRGGVLVGLADLVVELVGTHTGGWHYNKSVFFITGTVPIELVVLFTSSGVWLGALHLMIHQFTKWPDVERMLLILLAITLAFYGWSLAQQTPVNMIVFTLPFGLWGLVRIKSRKAQAGAVLLAAVTALADGVIETWAVGAGNYAYEGGFTLETPLTYALLVLGFVGIIEKHRPQSHRQ
jgi:hypothetical protein